ncbi:hypothetical protein ZWY2020_003823 [Hordeum vulgare]|nr:hypothetical protein ZWY2020_003823 [Hordeum vulgare]
MLQELQVSNDCKVPCFLEFPIDRVASRLRLAWVCLINGDGGDQPVQQQQLKPPGFPVEIRHSHVYSKFVLLRFWTCMS